MRDVIRSFVFGVVLALAYHGGVAASSFPGGGGGGGGGGVTWPLTVTSGTAAPQLVGPDNVTFQIRAGSLAGSGGQNLWLYAGDGVNAGDLGGSAILAAGNANGGDGNNVTVTASHGNGTNSSGGNVTYTAGNKTGSGTPGSHTFYLAGNQSFDMIARTGGGGLLFREVTQNFTAGQFGPQDSFAIYMKGDKLVFAYDVGAAIRYLTIPLDGSTTTWTNGAGAP